MNHREFIASLTAHQKQFLTQKNNVDGLISFCVHVGGIAGLGYLIYIDTAFAPIFMLLQGILIVFLFTLLHETIHRSAFASNRLNQITGVLSSYLIFLPRQWFRYFHFEHHRHTHLPGKDPELDSPKPQTPAAYIVYLSGIPTWRDHLKTIFRNAFLTIDDRYVPASAHAKLRTEARCMLAVYSILVVLSLSFRSAILLNIWIIPVLLGQPFLRLYLMAEHDHCPFVTNMFQNTRTMFTNGLVKRIAWNMPYHAEHHTYPSVPFHKLPALHRLIKEHLQETEHGYAKFSRKYFARLR